MRLQIWKDVFFSIKLETNQIIYVDSNSNDKSIDVAKKCKIKKIVKFINLIFIQHLLLGLLEPKKLNQD